MTTKIKNFFTALCLLFPLLTASCKTNKPQQPLPPIEQRIAAETVYPEDPNMIRTPEGANALDLETPLRCNVNWQTQEMVLTLPYNISAFKLDKNGVNDPLPRFEVTGFSFDTMPAEKALYKLVKEAGIKLVAKDAPYASISAENLRGEFSEVVNMIADAGEIYYTYNAAKKTMRISRKADFTLYVPQSRPIILGLLDVLRGSGITNITTDWADYSISFEADFELRNKIMNLIKYFENNPTLVAYDVSVFRIYPYTKTSEIQWKDMLNVFDFGTITTAKTGVIGRVLTTTDELNISSLRRFLGQQAMVLPVAEGKFVVPNLWFSRFDIGKCGRRNSIEADLSILAKASLEKNNRIFSDITLENTGGQITQFSIRSKLGENFLIIGIPNELFGVSSPRSETVIFMVPRIIRTLKTSKPILNKI